MNCEVGGTFLSDPVPNSGCVREEKAKVEEKESMETKVDGSCQTDDDGSEPSIPITLELADPHYGTSDSFGQRGSTQTRGSSNTRVSIRASVSGVAHCSREEDDENRREQSMMMEMQEPVRSQKSIEKEKKKSLARKLV